MASRSRCRRGAVRATPGKELPRPSPAVGARRPQRPPVLRLATGWTSPSKPPAFPSKAGHGLPRRGRGPPLTGSASPRPATPGRLAAALTAAGPEAPLPAAVPPRGGGSGRLRPHLWRSGGGGGRRSAQTGRRPAAP